MYVCVRVWVCGYATVYITHVNNHGATPISVDPNAADGICMKLVKGEREGGKERSVCRPSIPVRKGVYEGSNTGQSVAFDFAKPSEFFVRGNRPLRARLN